MSHSWRSADRERSRTGRRRYIFPSRSAHLGARERSSLILPYPIRPIDLPIPDPSSSHWRRSIAHRSRRDRTGGVTADCLPTSPHRQRSPHTSVTGIDLLRAALASAARHAAPTAGVTADCLPTSPHRERSPTPASRASTSCAQPSRAPRVTLPPPAASPRTACRRLPIVSVRPHPRHGHQPPARSPRERRASRCPHGRRHHGLLADVSPSPTFAHPRVTASTSWRSARDRRASRCPHRRRHHGVLADVAPSPAFAHARATGNNLLRAALALATRHVAPAPASPRIARRRLPVVSLGLRQRHSRRASRVTNRDRRAPHGHSVEVTTDVSPDRAGSAAASTTLSCCPIIAIAGRHAAPQCQANTGSLSTSDLYRTQ